MGLYRGVEEKMKLQFRAVCGVLDIDSSKMPVVALSWPTMLCRCQGTQLPFTVCEEKLLWFHSFSLAKTTWACQGIAEVAKVLDSSSEGVPSAAAWLV